MEQQRPTYCRVSTQKGMKQPPTNVPQQTQVPTGEPAEGAGMTGKLCHKRLVAGRTTHLDWVVELKTDTGCCMQTICPAVVLAFGMGTGWV